MSGFVYFARPGNANSVKIGWAKDVARRMRELQTAQPKPFKVLLQMPGSRATEGRLHHKFADLRVSGEWFHLKDPIKIFIHEHGGPRLILDRWRGAASDDDVREALTAASTRSPQVMCYCRSE